MNDLYSPLLLAALIAGGLGLTAGVVALNRRLDDPARAEGLRGVALGLGALGAGLAVLAVISHVALGHRPGTPEALEPLVFARLHPGTLVALGLGIAVYVFAGRAAGPE